MKASINKNAESLTKHEHRHYRPSTAPSQSNPRTLDQHPQPSVSCIHPINSRLLCVIVHRNVLIFNLSYVY